MPLRHAFQQSLQRLQDDVLILGSMVEGGIMDAVKILRQRDLEGAHRLIEWDARVNQKRFAIENEALTLIATQQPAAGDLRLIAAVLEIVTELERIGDYAKSIAKITLLLGEARQVEPDPQFQEMVEFCRDMLHQALGAFVKQDVTKAHEIANLDVRVDECYNAIIRKILNQISANPAQTDSASYLMWAAHGLERTGDRVVNICERVIFTVTGNMAEIDSHSSVTSHLPDRNMAGIQ
ncbi:MAG TPA: phosphate signaling complex protein PhoU [Anaerolineae bacterium]|nr:phosphate signaling complex protein PhoU [Anaerolineae bacterium]HMR67173.1 phosphate signaling complex protein PhoU [Anaerolineae bacterium]